jgi:sulfur-oxidizing protein SoxY
MCGMSDGCRLTRRTVLGATALAGIAVALRPSHATSDPEVALAEQLFGRAPVLSDRLRLAMPAVFPNGYTVPLALEVDSPMTEADYVRTVHIVAPRNPLIRVASFHFTPASGRARVSTRIRLAEPQNVIAVAELNDRSLLMAKTWVVVEIDGCG